MRSYNRNIGVNFWFYDDENIFEKISSDDKCKTNKFDTSRTLEQLEFSVDDADQFSQFKDFLIKQVNHGNRQLNDWTNLLILEVD